MVGIIYRVEVTWRKLPVSNAEINPSSAAKPRTASTKNKGAFLACRVLSSCVVDNMSEVSMASIEPAQNSMSRGSVEIDLTNQVRKAVGGIAQYARLYVNIALDFVDAQ